ALARAQDRLALCEKHPEECEALKDEMSTGGRVSFQQIDGYTALRAMLPPVEKRALVLIDPSFEEQDEFAQIVDGLGEALKRFPSGTYAIWYPLTERARVDAFFERLQTLSLPPSWVAEVAIAGEYYGLKMRGCGLVVLNPPWQLDTEIKPWLGALASRLAQTKGAEARLAWLVHE
ncbi:MAG: 23S rRNA (adenine(2030)-N(6))-methyltransferase RlmJ, partial [Opitutaceae bacterium]